jgi:rod shape-determining protein MreC
MRDTRRRRLVLVVLLLVSLTLIALGSTSGPGGALRAGAGAVFGPVQRVVAGVFGPVRDFFGGVGRDQQARIDELQRENDQLRIQQRAGQFDESRLAELERLYRISALGQYRVVAAQVIALGPVQDLANTALLDAGARDGLKVGMTVINGDGLVGRIRSVSASTSTVLLATDPQFQVGARLEGSLQIGYVGGQGRGNPLKLTMFDPQAAMSSGDRVVTNQDAYFPGGVPIGEVRRVHGTIGSTSRTATLQPYVDFSALDIVGVVVALPRVDPRDSVLPPLPAPTPTPTPTPATPSTGPSASSSGSSTAKPSTGSSP